MAPEMLSAKSQRRSSTDGTRAANAHLSNYDDAMTEERHLSEHNGQALALSRFRPKIPRASAPSVVLLHGSPGSRHDWQLVVDADSGKNDLIAVDRPGYGLSVPSGMANQTITANSETIGGAIEAMCSEGAVIVGHSLAGGVALRLAIDRPDLVRGLVLVASIGTSSAILASDHFTAMPIIGEAAAFAMFRLFGRISPDLVARFATAGGPAPPRKFVSRSLRRTFQMKNAWRTYVREERSMIEETPDIEASLPGLDVPTLIVWGETDRLVPRTATDDLLEQIPGATLEVMADTGHAVPQERPDELAGLISEFTHSTR